MPDFDEVRLPEHISDASSGGPMFNTIVMRTDSGAEQRIAVWVSPLLRWDISYGIMNDASATELIKFFRAREGRLRGFRFKDWTDYRFASEELVLSTDGLVGQIVKRYTSGGITRVRHINKPVQGSLSFTVGGAPWNPTSIDYATGLVTLAEAAGPILATGELDVPVRFDTDQMTSAAEDRVRKWEAIPVVELVLSDYLAEYNAAHPGGG